MNLPVTIDNGAGERLTFERLERGDDGVERLIVRNEVQPGKGPPMHVHFRQAEALTVLEGRLGYHVLGGPPRLAGPGESARFDAGVPRRFWADGDEVLRCAGWISPPHNAVYILSEIYRSTRENGGAKPNDLDAAWLMHRYRSEFDMNDVPAFVERGVFPLLRVVGADPHDDLAVLKGEVDPAARVRAAPSVGLRAPTGVSAAVARAPVRHAGAWTVARPG